VSISESTIKAICESEFTRARDNLSDIRGERKKALEQYFLRPNGKERVGYSTAQTSETRDAVEAMLPIVLDMFLQPESPITFRPINAADTQQAMLETNAVNDVLHVYNNATLIFLKWFKDALLLKNGYVKVFWDDLTDDRIEKYQGITEDEYMRITAELGPRDEIIKVVEKLNEQTGEVLRDVKIRVSQGDPQVRIENIPPTRVVVSPEHNDICLTYANYVCHYEIKTKSDLVVDGYSKEVVRNIPTATRDDLEFVDERYIAGDSDEMQTGAGLGDWTRELVFVFEHYLRMDRNGDGKAELLKVTTAGGVSITTILDVEEVDFIPIIAITPFIVPHNHIGMGLADFTAQFQDANTHIQRQILDNLNLTNNPMLYVNTNSVKSIEAVAKARLGGVVAGTTDILPVQAIAVPFTARQSYEVLQDMRVQVERATGLSEAATGLNTEVLAQSTNLVGAMTLNQAQMRARMIATVMAETGVRELVLRIRELIMKNVEGELMVNMGGKYLPLSPRSWIKNRATMLRIGLGSVQKAERIAALQTIMTTQEKIFAAQQTLDGPLLNHQNVYNALNELAALTGLKDEDRYFTNPEPYVRAMQAQQPEPQPIDTALELEAAKTAVQAQKNAAEIEIAKDKLELDKEALNIKKAELQLKAREFEVRASKTSVKERFNVQ
jgi:hypothetical protein